MLAVVVTESPKQGFKAGPLVVLGHAMLELALLVALVIGFGSLLGHGGVKATLAIAGGTMLVWTAISMIVAVARDQAKLDFSEAGGASRRRTVVSGILSSLSNPYWTIWWATIGMGLLTKAYAIGIAGLVAFYVGHILGDLTWYSAVSGLIAAGRRWITPRVYRTMLVVAAVFLLALAGWFLYSGIVFVA
jgi:threonine/homoserine/homoserine lactone efflux protein